MKNKLLLALALLVSFAVNAASDMQTLPRPGHVRPNYTPVSIDNYAFFGAYLFGVGLLATAMWFFVHVKSLERSMRNS